MVFNGNIILLNFLHQNKEIKTFLIKNQDTILNLLLKYVFLISITKYKNNISEIDLYPLNNINNIENNISDIKYNKDGMYANQYHYVLEKLAYFIVHKYSYGFMDQYVNNNEEYFVDEGLSLTKKGNTF